MAGMQFWRAERGPGMSDRSAAGTATGQLAW